MDGTVNLRAGEELTAKKGNGKLKEVLGRNLGSAIAGDEGGGGTKEQGGV